MAEETYEEFKAKLDAKANAVKADIKAGRYRNGEIHENISQTNPIMPATREEREVKTDPYQEIIDRMMMEMLKDHREFMIAPMDYDKYMGIDIADEIIAITGRFSDKRLLHREYPRHEFYGNPIFKPEFARVWIDEWETPSHPEPEKPEPDWKRKTFFSGPSTPPSETKRKKLRAKRKKHK